MRFSPPKSFFGISAIGLFALSGSLVQADIFTVTSSADTGAAGTLRWAITQANATPGSTINIQDYIGTITLTSMLPVITGPVTINGGLDNSVSGNNQYRIFFVDASTSSAAVTISNLSLRDGRAQGGAGVDRGGGGMGAGGAIFVNAGNVTLSGVQFANNSAQGGKGGDAASGTSGSHRWGGGGGGLGGDGGTSGDQASGGGGGFMGDGGSNGGGGGGLVGNGGNGSSTAGGGGGGLTNGGDANGSTGGAGGSGGGKGASFTQASNSFGQSGSLYGGGGGTAAIGYGGISVAGNGGRYGGGGGVFDSGSPYGSGSNHAGNGGDFGGGGGARANSTGGESFAGNGGYGGGGGGGSGFSSDYLDEKSGNGGFGGGGGGAVYRIGNEAMGGAFGGNGGYFTKESNLGTENISGGGGGGAGLGGNVFVRGDNGATITFVDSAPQNGSVTGGAGGTAFLTSPLQASRLTPAEAGGTAGSNIFLDGGSTTFRVTSGVQTLNGAISDASPLGYSGAKVIKSGDGTLILSGSNTYGGGTQIEGGTLSLGHAGALGTAGTISFLGGTLQFGAANTTDYSARFSGAASQAYRIDTNGQNVTFASSLSSDGGSLTKLGTGELILNASNNLSGGFMLQSGSLGLAHRAALGDFGSVTFAGGTLRYEVANAADFSSRISSAAGQQVNIDTNGYDVTLGSSFASAGASVTKMGSGALTLSLASGSGGSAMVRGGTLALKSSSSAWTSIIVGGAGGEQGSLSMADSQISSTSVVLGQSTGSLGEMHVSGGTFSGSDVTVGSAGTGNFLVSGGNVNVSGIFSLGNSASGAGSLQITGGTTTIQNGSLLIGRAGSGSLSVNGGALKTSFVMLGDGVGSATVTSGTWDAGTLNVSGLGGTATLLVNGGYLTTTSANLGTLSGGRVTASVTSGTWDAGSLSVGAGQNSSASLNVSGGTVIGSNVDVGVWATGNLALSGAAGNRGVLSVNALTQGAVGTVIFDGGILQARSNQSNFITTYSAPGITIRSGGAFLDSNGFQIGISSKFSGAGGITKVGGGKVTLSGTSAFDGALSPDEGVLSITGQVTSGATSGIATSGATATLEITGSAASWTSLSDMLIGHNGGTGYLTISGGATASDTFALVGRTAGGAGHVTVSGPGSTWTHSAGLVIGTGGVGSMQVEDGGQVTNADGTIGGDAGSAGTVRVTGANSLWASGSYLVVGNAGAGILNIDGGGTVRIGASGTGVLTLGNSGGGTGVLNIGSGNGQPALASGTVLASIVTGGSGSGAKVVNFNHTDTAYTFAPQLAGTLRVEQNAGTTILAGSNTYTEGTTVSGGTLSIGSDLSLGAVSGRLTMNGGTLRTTANMDIMRQVMLGANSTFDLVNQTYLNVLNTVSGTGGLTKTGTGYLTLSGAQTYTGATQVQGGFFKVESGSLASSSVNLSSAIFYLSNSSGVLSANITGSGAFHRGGAGTSTLTGAVSQTVSTVIESGTLQVGNGGTSGSIGGNVVNNGTLIINRSDEVAFSGSISGSGAFRQTGAGTTILSGSNSFTGDTIVSAGRLVVNGSILGAARVQGGGTLGGSGVIGGAAVVEAGGTLSPGNSPGRITFDDDLLLNAGSTLLMEFGGTAAGMFDQIDVQGLFTAGGTLNLVLINGFTPIEGDSFLIFDGITPGFDAGSFQVTTNLGGGLSWDTSDLALTGELRVVPEPSTWILAGFGLLALLVLNRSRRFPQAAHQRTLPRGHAALGRLVYLDCLSQRDVGHPPGVSKFTVCRWLKSARPHLRGAFEPDEFSVR